MTRKIAFRAWDKKNKVWVGAEVGGVMDLDYSAKCNSFMFDNDSIDIPKEVIWCQFTGLLDKNGKEIYEGDIVSRDGTNHEVEFSHGSFDVGGYTEMLSIDAEESEIIGNIYEHPDLIK